MAVFDLARYHGDTWLLPVYVTDDATPPVAIDLTGSTIVFRLETESDDVEDFYFSDPVNPLITNTVGISIIRNDLLGTFSLTLTSVLMATLTARLQYSWDITVTSVAGIVLTYFDATYSIKAKAIN